MSEEGLILEVNLTAGSLLGVARNTLLKKSLTRFIFCEDQDIYYHHRKQLFEAGTAQVCELRLVKKDGSLFWARLESTVAQNSENGGTLCYTVISDITTERKQVDLIHSERMAIAGQLAAGVAHEFNNLLSMIGGSAEYAKGIRNENEIKKSLDMIVKSANRELRL